MTRPFWFLPAAIALLLIMVAEVSFSTLQESPSWDEGNHIYAGYMNWKHGEYDLNPEHPPLVKLIATLPLLRLNLHIAPRRGRFFKDEAYFDGHELLYRNGPAEGGGYSADTLLFRVHMAVFVFAFVLAVMLLLAGIDMFGPAAGLITLGIFVFDPTILANAVFVATDMGAACGFFATVYAFYRFVRQLRWQRAVMCGVALGFAFGTKHSAVLLPPILLLLALGEVAGRWNSSERWPGRDAARIALGLAVSMVIGVFILWGLYSFRFAMHPKGVSMRSLTAETSTLPPAISHAIRFCARHHLLPESYIYGFADVERVAYLMPTYIFGKVYTHGRWFYFPAILSLKWSVGVLGLLALAIYAFATGKVQRRREVFFLILPPLFYLAAAMASPLNTGVRHVLPIFPFVFAFIGGGSAWLITQRRAWIYPIATLLFWHAGSSLRTFPNYVPYANMFWGGPSDTHLYFTDSATDWGQQLKSVKQWTDAHRVRQCWFAYFPAPYLLPSDYGIPCRLLPTPDTMYLQDIDVPLVVHGPILISFSDLNAYEWKSKVLNPYQGLFHRQPDDVIADGVAVFYGDVSLPDASALEYIHRATNLMDKNPQAAQAAARQAVAVSPKNFMANWRLGNALFATGDQSAARAAYAVSMRRIAEMEPSAQEEFGPPLKKDIATALAKARAVDAK